MILYYYIILINKNKLNNQSYVRIFKYDNGKNIEASLILFNFLAKREFCLI
jgi:hypothetical protein